MASCDGHWKGPLSLRRRAVRTPLRASSRAHPQVVEAFGVLSDGASPRGGRVPGDTAWVLPEPWRVKAIEPIRLIGREARERALAEAGFNMFRLRSEDVFV